MSKNPVFPYALIAVLGILAVILISYVGVNQRAELAKEDNGEETEVIEEGEIASDPEEIYKNNCAVCHGDDLSDGSAPELTQVGNKLSEDEIKEIIINGTGSMPPGLVGNTEAELLAEWLSEME